MQQPEESEPLLKSSRVKFSPEEDEKLRILVNELGNKAWKRVAARMGTRTTRQCRERYNNYLEPTLINGPWEKEEDFILIQKVAEIGQKWSKIAEIFRHRSDVNIKNRYSLLVSKGLARAYPEKIEKKKEKKENLNIHEESSQPKERVGSDDIFNIPNFEISFNYDDYIFGNQDSEFPQMF